jgi:hypothetical protein
VLVRLLYASRAIAGIDAATADSILVQARRNNPARGITGLLCFSDDVFVQLIEGGRDAVSDLFAAILRDERHSHVRLLSFEETSERRFVAWMMGEVNLELANPQLLMRFSLEAKLDPFHVSAKTTMALLEELAATGAVASRTA